MTTAEFVKETSIPRSKVYYMEQLGIVKPRKELRGEYYVRYFSSRDLKMARATWDYVQEGFKWRVAHKKAISRVNGVHG